VIEESLDVFIVENATVREGNWLDGSSSGHDVPTEEILWTSPFVLSATQFRSAGQKLKMFLAGS